MPILSPPSVPEARRFLASTRLFGGLDDAALDEVAAQLEWWLVPGGSAVFRQGEVGDSLYLVASGRLVIVRELGDGAETLVGERGRGDSLGELAILTGEPRSATVRALRDTVLARLSRERAEVLLRKNPEALLALTRMLAGWLRPEPPERPRGCVAVAVTAASPEVALPELAERLAAGLSAFGPTLLLDARRVDALFGAGAALCPDGSAGHSRLAAWIDEQEAGHGFVVYQADPAATSAWTRRCLRQADHILVIAPAEATPSLGELGTELARLEADQGKQLEYLVLLHRDPDRRPRGTASWLALFPFVGHHHVRLAHPGDLDRVARSLSGNAVGVVLGGGGARGFAHIGVLRALGEAGIPVDRIGGASMGAMIAAQYARGGTWQEMLEVNRRGWVEMRPHKVYTLPVISVLSALKAERMLEMMYDDDRIEDLWIPYFCVSTNISRTELVVHRQGLVRDWISATITIPGITPPVVGPGGDLLVDGGVLNNLPVDVMRQLGPGPIIAVDVSATFDLRADPSYRKPPSPWQLLAGRLHLRAQPPFPTILRLIHRAALLASDVYAKQAKREVELYLDLPMDGYDMFDMDALDRIAEFGYSFAREKLAAAPLPGIPRGTKGGSDTP